MQSDETPGIEDTTYLEAKKHNQLGAKEAIDSLLSKHGVDVLCGPGEPDALFFTSAAIACYPIITVPLGYYPDGEPFGLALIAKPNHEGLLLSVAERIEGVVKSRKKPRFIKP